MKNLFIILLLVISSILTSQTCMSWNIQNLGESKFKKDSVLIKISQVIKSANPDIVAIQEVVTSNWGDSCIRKISKILNYDYTISKRTTGEGSERYAFLWKKDTKLVGAKLETGLQDSIDREPFTGIFTTGRKNIIISQVHLVPANKNPQYEVSKLYGLSKSHIICGDFNLTAKHVIYIPLLTKRNSPLSGQKTTLKRDGSISENNFDHFLVDKSLIIKSSKVYIYSFRGNRNLLSDHLPILLTF
jgi:deoxyribonuclease-1-like protein